MKEDLVDGCVELVVEILALHHCLENDVYMDGFYKIGNLNNFTHWLFLDVLLKLLNPSNFGSLSPYL